MKFKIYKYKEVTSTNDIAVNLIKNKKIYGCVCADMQTKGRGTHGKKWISIKGNLFSSLFFPLEKKLPTFNEFSLINPIIISSVIQKFCKNQNINLKYPNDIFLNKKKICGILQEVIKINKKSFLIIGIGLNVISNPKIKDIYETTSILKETNKRNKVINIIDEITQAYQIFFKDMNNYDFNKFKIKAQLMSFN